MAEVWNMTFNKTKPVCFSFFYFAALGEMQRCPLHLPEMFHAIWPWRNRNYVLMSCSSEFNRPTRLFMKRKKRTIGLWVGCFIVFVFFFYFFLDIGIKWMWLWEFRRSLGWGQEFQIKWRVRGCLGVHSCWESCPRIMLGESHPSKETRQKGLFKFPKTHKN